MVPKPLYEFLPYLYLFGGGLMIVGLGGYSTPVGLLLFSMGAWLWLMRSDYRRINRRQPEYANTRFFWGESIYELQPFCYILIGLLLFSWLEHPIRLLSGPLMVLVGAIVMLVRTAQRKKSSLSRGLRQKGNRSVALTRVAGRQRISSETVSTELSCRIHPPSANCDSCQIADICDSVKLESRTVQEIMRLSQTVSPDEAFGLYREAVERIEGRPVSDAELRSVLSLLYRYSDLCSTWRRTGRLSGPDQP